MMKKVAEWVDAHVREVGPEALAHIKYEYRTMDWIMEGILNRTGFVIETVECQKGLIHIYVCRKPAKSEF